jgi:hypothetical protein
MVVDEGLCFLVAENKTGLDIACVLELILLSSGTLSLYAHCMKNTKAKQACYIKQRT